MASPGYTFRRRGRLGLGMVVVLGHGLVGGNSGTKLLVERD